MLQAPIARGYFLGDYMGLVAAGHKVFPAFGIEGGKIAVDITDRDRSHVD